MGTTNALKMRLDFLFNTKAAEKGVASLTKGFNRFDKTFNMMGKYIPVAKGLMGSIGQVSDIMKGAAADNADYGDSLNKLISKGSSLENLAGGMDKVYNASVKMGKSVKTASDVDVLVGSLNVLDRAYMNAGASVRTLEDILKGFDPKGDRFTFGDKLTKQITELEAENPKLAKSLHNINIEAASYKESLNGKQLVQYSALMMGLAKAYANDAISAKEYNKQLGALNYRTKFLNKTLPQLKKDLKGLAGGLKSQFVTALGVLRVMDDALSAQEQTVETTHRLALKNVAALSGGKTKKGVIGFTSTILSMNKAVRDVGLQTGISMTAAAEAINSLASARVSSSIKDLNKLAITSVRMQQAFGISESSAADLFRTLTLVGGLGTKSVKAVAEQMAKVQAVFGMTAGEATEVAAEVGNIINRMSGMGASSMKNAKIVAREVSKMTVTFTRAGLSAQDASNMIDRFMDPTKIEDNVLLWHNMGISVAKGLKMMAGDASTMEGMTDKLGAAAYRLKKQYGGNVLALQAMSEANGMTIQQVNQLSREWKKQQDMSPEQIKNLKKQASLEKASDEARQSMIATVKRLAAVGNVLMQTFIMPLLDFLTPIVMEIAKLAQGFTNLTKKLGPLGGVIRVAMGSFILFTALTMTNAFKLLKPIGALGEGFGKMFGGIVSGAKKGIVAMGKFMAQIAAKLKNKTVTNGLTKLGTGIENAMGGGKTGTGATGKFGIEKMTTKGPSSSIGAGPELDKGTSATEKLSKINGKNLMQLGVGLAAVAAAILLLAVAFKVLVGVVQTATLKQMAGAIGIMAVMLGVLVAAVALLGVVASAADAPLLILGGAMLMIAGSVAILVGAFYLLNKIMKSGLDPKTFKTMAAMMGLLIVAVAALGAVALYAGPGLLLLGGAMMMAAASVAILGAGLLLIGIGLNKITQTISKTGPEFVKGAKNMAAGIYSLLIPLTLLGVVGAVAGAGLIIFAAEMLIIGLAATTLVKMFKAFSSSITEFVDGLKYISKNAVAVISGLATLGIGLLALGALVTPVIIPLLAVGAAFVMMGAGMALVSLGFKFFSESIVKLSGHVGKLALIMGTLILLAIPFAAALVVLAAGAAVVAIPLLALGSAIVILGAGMTLAGAGMQLFTKGLVVLSKEIGGILLTSLKVATAMTAMAAGMVLAAAAIVPVVLIFTGATLALLLFSVVALSIGKAFEMMGTGTEKLARSANGAIAGIKGIKAEMGGMHKLAKEFNSAIDSMTESFIKLGKVQDKGLKGLKAYRKIVHDIKVEVQKSDENDKASAQMDEANKHLNNISGFTARTAAAVEKLANMTKSSGGGTFIASVETGL